MSQTNNIIAGAAVGSVFVIGGIVLSVISSSPECDSSKINLGIRSEGKEINLCLTNEQYLAQKQSLIDDFNKNRLKNKNYDFDINNQDLLFAVLGKEAKDNNLKPPFEKEELLNLLK